MLTYHDAGAVNGMSITQLAPALSTLSVAVASPRILFLLLILASPSIENRRLVYLF